MSDGVAGQIAELQKQIRRRPADVLPRVALARLYRERGALLRARQELQKAFEVEAESPTVLFNLALLHLREGELLLAAKLLGRMQEHTSDALADCFAEEFELAGYLPWPPRTLPGSGPIKTRVIADALAEMVEFEGPLVVVRAYRLYGRASGHPSLGGGLLAALRGATSMAVQQGTINYLDFNRVNPDLSVVGKKTEWSTGVPRIRGPRLSDEVPSIESDQLRARMRRKLEGCDESSLDKLVQICYGRPPTGASRATAP
jgi:hypothetical protein